MTIPSFSQLTSVTACLCLPWLVQAQKTYTVNDLGSLGGDFVSAFAVNQHGQIAGRASTPSSPTHAFLFSAGLLTDLGSLPGWTRSRAQGINNRTQIVGFSAGSPTDIHAFLWSNGQLTDIHPIVSFGGTASFAFAINDAGHIAGDATTSHNVEDHAFLLRNGTVLDLGTLGGTFSASDAVSAADMVVGVSSLPGDAIYHAFLWDGTLLDLGSLGGSYSEAFALNNEGIVAGFSLLPGDTVEHAFRYRHGILQDLHTPALPANSAAIGINNSGQIVGVGLPTTDDVFTGNIALLWDGDEVIDLNSRIPAGSGWQLYRAAAINDRGDIVGVGNHNGQIRAFLLTSAQ